MVAGVGGGKRKSGSPRRGPPPAGLLALVGLLALLSGLTAASVAAAGGQGRVTATVRVNPLRLTVEAPERVATGERFQIEAVVTNWGPVPLSEVRATLYPPEGLTVHGNAEKRLGNLRGGMTKKATWQARAEEPGLYVVLVIAAAVDGETGAAVTAQATTNIIAEGGPQRGGTGPSPPPWDDRPGGTTPPLPPWQDEDDRERDEDRRGQDEDGRGRDEDHPPSDDGPGGTTPPLPPWQDEDDRGRDEDDHADDRGRVP